MKYSMIACLALLFVFLSNCTEDELLSTSYIPADVAVETMKASDPRVPQLNSVTANGSKVTLTFTNPSAPKYPKGGFELMLNGKRTRNDVVSRVRSSEKKISMTFRLEDPNSYEYQIFARWNNGYLSSNKLLANTGDTGSQEEETAEQESSQPASSASRTEQADSSTPNEVSAPSNPRQPVISNVTFNGSRVTLEFVNFSAPGKPEGGFELMLNGKRTATQIVPRMHSTEKNLTMSFTLNNPDSYIYQIYARWNSGYLSSEKFYPEQARQGGNDNRDNDNGNTSGGGGGNSTPDYDDREDDRDDSDKDDSYDDGGSIPGLPSLKLVRGYEFENNIGRNVSKDRDGLQVHHLGNQGGRVVSIDGVGAYHFRATADSDRNHRHELIPRNLPTPNFQKGFISTWGEEYVYEMRVRISEDYEMGSGYTSFLEIKNDYDRNRRANLAIKTEGDHYRIKQYASTSETNDIRGDGGPEVYLDANGRELKPGVDFNKTTKRGNGYPGIDTDKGKWVKWTVHAKWAYDHSGFLKIYKDGKLFYSHKGPNSFKDKKAPYVKFGLYNSYWKNGKKTGAQVQETYVDYFRVYLAK